MTKMSKVKINARRKEQSAERKVKSAQRQLSHALMEAQIAALEAQIASLEAKIAGLQASDLGLPTSDFRLQEEASSVPPQALFSPQALFPRLPTSDLGLQEEASSVPPQALFPPQAATLLQTWLDALRNVDEQFFSSLSPFANVVLTPSDRRRALGSGVRRYGFIDQVSDAAEENPQFWPAYFDDQAALTDGLKKRIREIEVLRNLLVFFESGARSVLDMLLTAGNDAFLQACVYYRSVRNAARERNPQGEALYQMLRLFWHRRRKTTEEEPTVL